MVKFYSNEIYIYISYIFTIKIFIVGLKKDLNHNCFK